MTLTRNPGEVKEIILPTTENTNNNEINLTKDIVTFDSLINNFKNSGGLYFKSKAVLLEGFKKTLNSKNLQSVNNLLYSISIANNNDEINKYFGELEKIFSKYEVNKGKVIDEAKKEAIASIDKLSKISIDGGSSKEEILSDIYSYIDKINLDEELKALLRNKLISIVNNYEEGKEIGLKSIDSYFNELGNNLEEMAGGKYQLTIEDGNTSETIIFKNKQEAINLLVDMKSKAESQFQSLLRTGLEGVSNFYINRTIGLGKGFLEDEMTAFDEMKNNIDNSDWGYFVGSILIMGVGVPLKTAMLGSLFYMAHTGVAESIYRRSTDPFVNNSTEKQMEDYLRITTDLPELDTPEGKEYIEVKQRGLIIDLLKQKLDTDFEKETKDYIKFKDNINTIEKFRLNKSPTFYYLVNKLVSGSDLGFKSNFGKGLAYNLHSTLLKGMKLYYPKLEFQKSKKFIKGVSLDKWKYDPSQKIARSILNKLEEGNIEKLNEGLKLFYTNKEVKLDRINKEQIEIKYEGSDNKKILYNKIISYIKSKDISSEKKNSLIIKFEEYIDMLGKSAKGEGIIKKDLYIMLETNFSNKVDLIDIVKKEIKILEKNKSKITKFGEKIIDKISFGKIKSKLFKLHNLANLIDSEEWVGSKRELQADLQKIESGDKVGANYTQKTNGVDFETKFLEYKVKGQEFFEGHKEVNKLLFDNNSIENFTSLDELDNRFKSEDLLNIQNHINYILSNDLEKQTEININYLLKKLISGDILFKNIDEFYIEIDKILKGNLSNIGILDKLGEIKSDKLSNESKVKLDELNNLVKNGFDSGEKFYINSIDLSIIIKAIKSGNNLDIINFDLYKVSPDIAHLKSTLSESKDLYKYDFKDSLVDSTNLNKLKESIKLKYKDEISYLKILNKIDGIDFDLNKELNNFSIDLEKNNYTYGQTEKILNKIFNGIEFKDLDLDVIINSTLDHSEEFNIKQKLQDLLENKFNSLDKTEKKKILNFIENNKDIQKNILPKNIETALNSKLDNIKVSFDSFKEEFEEGIDIERKKEIRKELDKLIKGEGIDQELLDDIKSLKTEINNSINSGDIVDKDKTSTETTKTNIEKIELQKEQSIDLLSRAKLEAMLRGVEIGDHIDYKIFEISNMDKNIPTLDVLKDDLMIKGISDIRDRDLIKSEIVEFENIKNTLDSVAKTKKLNAIDSYKGRSFFDNLVKYIKESAKSAG